MAQVKTKTKTNRLKRNHSKKRIKTRHKKKVFSKKRRKTNKNKRKGGGLIPKYVKEYIIKRQIVYLKKQLAKLKTN